VHEVQLSAFTVHIAQPSAQTEHVLGISVFINCPVGQLSAQVLAIEDL
jgi:hypothetical protein